VTGTHRTGNWLGPKTGLGALVVHKEITPPAGNQIAIPFGLSRSSHCVVPVSLKPFHQNIKPRLLSSHRFTPDPCSHGYPKPFPPTVPQQFIHSIGMWPIRKTPPLYTMKLFRHCTAEATKFARILVQCRRVSSDIERKVCELESGNTAIKLHERLLCAASLAVMLYIPPVSRFNNSAFCPRCVFTCFVWISQVRQCLLSFGAESFVFQFAIQKLKDQDI
jgi:hypothetical protein